MALNTLISSSRLYTAIAMLLAIVMIILFHQPLLIWSVLGIAYMIGFYEAFKLYCKTPPTAIFFTFALGIWIWSYYFPPLLGVFLVWILFASYQAYTKKGTIWQLMPFIYPTIPFVFLYLLYLEYSIGAIVWLLFIVALSDTGAFFGGKLLGGTIFTQSGFCPTSPNKTKEGVLVGVLSATFIGAFVGLSVCESFWQSFVFSFTASLASIFGDLYESYLKRNAEVKDSGSIFPGHGGMLDRLDGYFFGGVILYILLNLEVSL